MSVFRIPVLLLLTALAFFPAAAMADTYRLVTTRFLPFTDPDHAKGGFLGEIAHEAFARRGHIITINFRPWPRAMKEAREGEADGLLSAFYNEERSKVFHFSAPLNSTRMVLVGMKKKWGDRLTFKTLAEFDGLSIATGRKWAYSEAFEKHSGFDRVLVGSEEAGIRMLFANRVNLFAVNDQQFRSVINQMPGHDIEEVRTLLPAISSNDQHIAATRLKNSSLKFLSEFNTGLASLKASGDYDRIHKKHF